MAVRKLAKWTATSRRTAGTPLSRILVATDGGGESLGALHVAAALGRRAGTTVTAVGVASAFPHALSSVVKPEEPVAVDEGSRRELQQRVERTLRDLPGTDQWEVQTVAGWPPEAINALALRWGATLVVLGIGRHRRVDRLFGSETAIAVMRHAMLPVLAVAPSAQELPHRVLAAMDFTEASATAAELAAQLMADGGTLTLAHASSFAGGDHALGGLVDLYQTGARAKLEETRRRLQRHSRSKIETTLIGGEAGQALLSYASEHESDLISLGGHEQGLVDRILLGSVRTRVVRAATCSVLIAPPRAT